MRAFRAVSGLPPPPEDPADREVVVVHEERPGRGPLLPVLLVALLAMAVVALLAWGAISLVRDEGDGTDPPAAGERARAGDTLVVGDEPVDLLGLSGGSLLPRAGQEVRGTVEVQSVVADEGFWVGVDDERVYVHLTREARGGGGESEATVEGGDLVTLSGELAPVADHGQDVAGVTVQEGRDQLVAQGALVRAADYSLEERDR